MREQTFQCLLKPHSCGASWRDKKLPAGGTQPNVLTGIPSEPPEGYPAEFFNRAFNKSYQGQCSHPAPAFVRGKKGFPLQIAGSMVEYPGIM